MSREIKFRVYDETSNYYVAILDNDCFSIKQMARIILELEMLGHKYIIEQYTGLKDKNDKEIYEGDIVSCYSLNEEYGALSVVKYGQQLDVSRHEYCPYLQGFYLDEIDEYEEVDEDGYMEVVGNIHESNIIKERK